MKSGYIYVLTNEAFPGFLKIGRTKKAPESRAKELSTTGVPSSFEVAYSTLVDDVDVLEVLVHKALELKGVRYNSRREFFEMSVSEAVSLIESLLTLIVSESERPLSEVVSDTSSIDFSQEDSLQDFIYSSIKLPDFGEHVSEGKALELEMSLSRVGYKGCPIAFKEVSKVYMDHFLNPLKFKEYYLIYLEYLKKSSFYRGLFNLYSVDKRRDVGREAAEFLSILSDKGWLTSSDFNNVQKFLIEGDSLIYEGYINQVSRSGFLPDELQKKAINL